MKQTVEDVIAAYGGVSEVQKRFDYKRPMGVYAWRIRGLPKKFIADIFIDTEIPIEKLKLATDLDKQAV